MIMIVAEGITIISNSINSIVSGTRWSRRKDRAEKMEIGEVGAATARILSARAFGMALLV